MNLYDIIKNLSEEGYSRIRTNLIKGDLQIAKTKIIENGKQIADAFEANGNPYSFDSLIGESEDICKLYAQYKTSLPGENDCNKTLFKAKSIDELTDAELVTGIPRTEARIKLETYILLASVDGRLKWLNENHWYEFGHVLAGKEYSDISGDKDFVILRKMIQRDIA